MFVCYVDTPFDKAAIRATHKPHVVLFAEPWAFDGEVRPCDGVIILAQHTQHILKIRAAYQAAGIPEVGAPNVRQEKETEAPEAEVVSPADESSAPVAVHIGGPWYELQVDGVTIQRVRGKDAAEAAVNDYRT